MYSLLLLALLFILLIGGREYYSVFYGLAMLILFSYLYSIYIKRGTSAVMFISKNEIFRDDNLKYQIVMQNNAVLPVFNMQMTVKPLDVDCSVRYIAPLRQISVSGTKSFKRRGRYTLGPVEISGREPFGLFSWHRDIVAQTTVTVYPKVYQSDLISFFLRDENGLGTLSIRQNSGGPYDIREYAPGDSLKKIHWKLTAKHDELMVREYRDSVKTGIRILFDMRENIYDDKGEEEALSLLLSSIASYLNNNLTTEIMLINKENKVITVRDKRDFKSLLDNLVDMQFDGVIKDDLLYRLLLSEDFIPRLIIVPKMSEGIYRISDAFDCSVITVMDSTDIGNDRTLTPSMWRGIFEESNSKTDIYVLD